MKIQTLAASLLLSLKFAFGQEINPTYDSVLARQLGADEYGMKSYVLVILKTGSVTMNDKIRLDSLFTAHLANIDRLAEEGKLILAGPVRKNENQYRGIFILNVNNLEAAQDLLQSDPTIREKILDAELYHWYGSAALPTYLENHRKIEKNSIF